MKSTRKIGLYLDYAATTPIDSSVSDEIIYCIKDPQMQGNPSSIHRMGMFAKNKIEESRQTIAKNIGVKSSEIIFTGSGTESDNLTILGVAKSYKKFGNHIIISAIEHKAVIEATKSLESDGFEVSFAPVDNNGFVVVDKLIKLIRKDTILISIMYVNNEIGSIQPIKEISLKINEIKKSNGLPFLHTDACQAATVLSVNPKKLGVDLMTLNGSKIYGPKSIGCLYIRNGIKIEPIIYGGGQEFGIRAGTESISLIAGFAKALTISQNNYKKEFNRLLKIKKELIKTIKKIKDISFNSPSLKCSPNILNVSFLGAEGESLVLELDNQGVYCSTGSACASRSLKSSHVLVAMGKDDEVTHTSIRFSIGRFTKEKDIKELKKVLSKCVERIRKNYSL